MNKNKFFTKNRIIYMSLALLGIVLFVISTYVLDYAELLREKLDLMVVGGYLSVIHNLGLAMQYGGGASIIVGLLGVVFSKTMNFSTTLISLVADVTLCAIVNAIFTSQKAYHIESNIFSAISILGIISSICLLFYYAHLKGKFSLKNPRFNMLFSFILDVVTVALYFLPCIFASDFCVSYLNYLIHR